MANGLPAIVKAGTKEKARGLFGAGPETEIQLTSDASGIRVKAVPQKLSAKAEDGNKLKPNSRVLLVGPELTPPRYTFLVTFNPALLKAGSVSCPSFLSCKDFPTGLQLGLVLTAGLDLEELDWVFELRAVD